jgi:hypothetical protein
MSPKNRRQPPHATASVPARSPATAPAPSPVPASPFPEPMRAVFSAFAHHGKPYKA